MSRLIDPREQHARRLAVESDRKPEPRDRWYGHLSRAQVAYVKRRLLTPRWGLETELAAELGVTRQAISLIAVGRSHRSVQP